MRAWEPPSRLLLDWQINCDFGYDPDLLTEVELSFTPAAGGGTLVTRTASSEAGKDRCKTSCISPPERVYQALTTEEGPSQLSPISVSHTKGALRHSEPTFSL